MDSGAGSRPDPSPDPLPLTPELLAGLQAGLLDDDTAARVRRQARADPEAARVLAALDSVRRELADLGSDAGSAPEVPATVTAKVGAALRTAPPPDPSGGGHSGRPRHFTARPRLTRAHRAGLVVGICAAAAAVGLGALTLNRDPGPAFPRGPTASQITVDGTADTAFPLSDAELRAALGQMHDLGPLADPRRRAACLTALGHSPTSEILGGRTLELSGRSAVLLVVAGGAPGQLVAVAVEPTCSAAHTGLLAERVLPRQ